MKNKYNILSCDPSIRAWGWSVINEDGNIIDCGCIKTEPSAKKLKIRKGDDRTRRVSEINTQLLNIISKYDIQLIISEQPHGSQSAVSAIMIGIVLGVLQTLSNSFDIPIEWYSEGDCKNNLLGKRNASKNEVKQKINTLFPKVKWTNIGYKDEAIADSLAVYHLAKYTSSIIKFFIKHDTKSND